MARPTSDQERELEDLETASIALCDAEELAAVLWTRFQQALVRALGDEHLLRVLRPGARQATVLRENLVVCRGLLNGMLAARQDARCEANRRRG